MRALSLLRWILVVATLAAAAVTVDPEILGRLDPALRGISMRAYVGQAIAMRPLLALGAAGVAVLVLLVALARRGRATAVLGVGLALVAAAHAGVLLHRGVDAGARLPDDAGSGSPEAFTVLTYNTHGGAVSHDDVAELMAARDADVAVLPETNAGTAQRVQEEMAARGRSYALFTGASSGLDHSAIAVLVAAELGEYAQSDGPPGTLANIRLDPVDPSTGAPRILGVHPISPAVGHMERWRDDVAAVTDVCREPAGDAERAARLVVAGDFNATLDHAAMRDLGGCVDAASQAGVGAVGTWPASLPALLGASIDHVLVEESAWRTTAAEVVDAGGSDHRGVLARLEAR